MQLSEPAKVVVDTLSVATVFASLATWLPPAAALASLIWTVIRIWETPTMQYWLRRRKQRCADCDAMVRGDL